jgi:hypothetical protein
MSRIIQVLGTEAAISTADDLNGAQLVRIYNNNEAAVVITIADSEATTLGTFTIVAGAVEYVRKKSTDTIAAVTSCKMVAVAFGD